MRTSRLLLILATSLILAGLAFAALNGISAQAQDGTSTPTPGENTGPGPVVFSSNRSGSYQIYVLDPNTDLATQLTDVPGNNIDPVWSSDGKLIAFASDRDGIYQIYVMSADGSGLRALTNNDAQNIQPRWQPGDQWVVFNSNVNRQWDVYAVSLEGGIVQQLTNDPADERGALVAGAASLPETGMVPPTFTPAVPTPIPDAVVISANLHVRENPGEGAPILLTIPMGTPLKILGRFPDNSWIQVMTPNGNLGWVSTAFISINVNLLDVPVIPAAFIAPPPTPIPTMAATLIPAPTPVSMLIEFWSDRGQVKPGKCATLFWNVQGIKAVYFQGNGVAGQGSSTECPMVTTTYHLQVILMNNTETNRYISLLVKP